MHYGAIKYNGQVWLLGFNRFGELGDNTTTNRGSPVLVVGNHTFVECDYGGNYIGAEMGAYGFSAARKNNGQVWTWGANDVGQLGTNNLISRSSPVLVVGNHSFTEISCGADHMMALKSDGMAWGWGNNNKGSLGTNNVIPRSSPVPVVGSHSFITICAGHEASYGLKANGQVWSWGDNEYGQLGDNTNTNRSSPVLVVGNHSFISIACHHFSDLYGSKMAAALKSNGQVWTWGTNYYGELGNDTLTNASSPVLVVGNHSFIKVVCGGFHMLALKENGEVWAWGRNHKGQLGVFDDYDRSSPVLVVGNHSFIDIRAGRELSLALKSNGELWKWGDYTESPILIIGNHSFASLWGFKIRQAQSFII